MSRYIDADALVAEFKRLTLGENSLIERVFADGVYAVIETFPTADVVEVVMCKDCSWYNSFTLCCGNPRGMFYANQNGYCSYGERREEK